MTLAQRIIVGVSGEVAIITVLLAYFFIARRKINRHSSDKRQQFADETRAIYEQSGLPPYIITPGGKSIICLYCGWESYNPNDVANKYCGHCHAFIMDKYENQKAAKDR
jgi:ribosomal protein L37E